MTLRSSITNWIWHFCILIPPQLVHYVFSLDIFGARSFESCRKLLSRVRTWSYFLHSCEWIHSSLRRWTLIISAMSRSSAHTCHWSLIAEGERQLTVVFGVSLPMNPIPRPWSRPVLHPYDVVFGSCPKVRPVGLGFLYSFLFWYSAIPSFLDSKVRRNPIMSSNDRTWQSLCPISSVNRTHQQCPPPEDTSRFRMNPLPSRCDPDLSFGLWFLLWHLLVGYRVFKLLYNKPWSIHLFCQWWVSQSSLKIFGAAISSYPA